MRHTITTTLLLLIIGFAAKAQTITNAGFEAWTPSGQPAPFDWEEPTGWKSTNAATEFTSAGCKQSDSARTSDHALNLQSVNIDNGRPSIVCNGDPELIFDFSNPRLDIITGGEPISSKPKYLQGYYRFENVQANDSAYVVVILKKWNTLSNKRDTVAIGTKLLSTTSGNYTMFEVEIEEMLSTEQPDSVVIAFYSTNPNNPKAPTFGAGVNGLLIDDISFSNTSSVNTPQASVNISVYPNPASDKVTITTGNNEAIQTIALIDITGKTILTRNYHNATEAEVALAELKNGIYFVRVTTGKGIVTQKLTVTK